MKIVYAVSQGDYSDYRIEAMFSTEEMAQKYIKRCKETGPTWRSDTHMIEEFELDNIDADWLDGKVNTYRVMFKPDSADIDTIGTGNFINFGQRDGVLYENGRNMTGVRFNTIVFTDSEESAAKIAMERRSIYLANNPPKVNKKKK